MKVITLGAVIRDVRLAGIGHPLVLGFDGIDDYVNHSPHFGAVAGRCANRTGGGRLVIDGHLSQLSLNEKGGTHLHGGFKGFGKRAWRLVGHDASSVTLAIHAADGEEGYPGNVEATVRYAIEAPGTIRMVAEATTDAPTVVNLAQHSYFNLDDSPGHPRPSASRSSPTPTRPPTATACRPARSGRWPEPTTTSARRDRSAA